MLQICLNLSYCMCLLRITSGSYMQPNASIFPIINSVAHSKLFPANFKGIVGKLLGNNELQNCHCCFKWPFLSLSFEVSWFHFLSLSITSCKHNIDILSLHKVDMANVLANRCLLTQQTHSNIYLELCLHPLHKNEK